MDSQIVELGRTSLLAMADDLKSLHGLDLDRNPTDEVCYRQGLRVIESNKQAEIALEEERRRDDAYLASLSEEERTFVILKRKYEPNEMGG